jgi:lipopolysaccharide export system permease protein
MLTYQKFIAKLYLKNFLLIFVALELFFTGMDLLENLSKISSSANLQVLYTANKLLFYINFTLPLSLVFAMFLTLLNILKSNELVSLYALGVSKKELLNPIMIISTIATLIFIGLNFIPDYINAYEKSVNIRKYDSPTKQTEKLFLKSYDTYAYIDQLRPQNKSGTDLKIFITKDNKLVEILKAKTANFTNDSWNLKDVTSIKIPDLNSSKKLIYTHFDSKDVLQGFKPEIIDTLLGENTKLTIPASIEAIDFLDKQNLNSKKIKANLFTMVFFPLFAPIVIYGLFFPLPEQRRGTNIALLSSIYVFSILCIWGVLFIMTKITTNGALSAESGILLPIALLAIGSLYLSRKYGTKHI